MFLTAAQIEHLKGKTDTSRCPSEADDDVIASGEALFMFRDLRNEVTLLAQLDHPYIVALLGGYCCTSVSVGMIFEVIGEQWCHHYGLRNP